MDEQAVAWLRERIEARLATAQAAPGPAWRVDSDGCCVLDDDDYVMEHATRHPWLPGEQEAIAAHIAFNDPRQIIADCEADLAILDLREMWASDPGLGMAACALGDAVRHLATKYRHQDGYTKHWSDA